MTAGRRHHQATASTVSQTRAQTSRTRERSFRFPDPHPPGGGSARGDPGTVASGPPATRPTRQEHHHDGRTRTSRTLADAPDDGFHVFDTTLRDGAQREGINLTVADKLTIARHLDDFGVGFIEGGWPGANPRDTEFFARAREELDFRHAQLVAFGATRRAGRQGRRGPAGRGAAGLRRPGGHPGRQVARPARRARAAHHAGGEPGDGPRHRRLPARPGPPGVRRLRALLRRLPGQPRVRHVGGPGRARGRRRRGRAVRHQRRHAARRRCRPVVGRGAGRRPAPGSASTPRTTPAARSPTPWPPSTPAPPTCSAPPTATASGSATPTSSRWSPRWS